MDETATGCGGEGWTLANRAFFFICKSVSSDKSGTDVMSSVCLIKVSNDAREWTHHDHTASELPDNTRNV